jgi:heat shock protein HslJ
VQIVALTAPGEHLLLWGVNKISRKMEKRMKKLVYVLLALLVLAACSGQNTASIEGSWKLVSYGDPANPTAAAPEVETSIELKDGQVTGNVGCNGFGGKYEVDGNKITFSEMMSTLMFCEGPVGDQETSTLNVLHETAAFVLDGDSLTITSQGGNAFVVLARK